MFMEMVDKILCEKQLNKNISKFRTPKPKLSERLGKNKILSLGFENEAPSGGRLLKILYNFRIQK